MHIDDLYQDLIIDHGTKPRNFREISNCCHFAEGYNPLCGDKLKIFVALDAAEQRITDISFTGQGCAISSASASILTQELNGLTRTQALTLARGLKELLLHDKPQELSPKLAALSNVKKYPSRIKCALLSWQALGDALNNDQSTSV